MPYSPVLFFQVSHLEQIAMRLLLSYRLQRPELAQTKYYLWLYETYHAQLSSKILLGTSRVLDRLPALPESRIFWIHSMHIYMQYMNNWIYIYMPIYKFTLHKFTLQVWNAEKDEHVQFEGGNPVVYCSSLMPSGDRLMTIGPGSSLQLSGEPHVYKE